MGNVNKIIVCAHCVYPQIISSEGIVNRNWFDILNQRYSNLELLSSEKSVKIIKNKYFISVDDNRLKALYYWSKLVIFKDF
ncbi:hypothetical protein FNW25_16685 [Flavobacterium franklandianum]|uniref:hypothetical protein n=1 Tax=Flavobacterium franklandianum TaxID=2594430 RepID=UPI001179A6F4|nr:hypothetical protein [Flavobacterium franklandianum]TRX16466.1 hypothetical protein FNW25_16685 [Flavobacterium franklandianum]